MGRDLHPVEAHRRSLKKRAVERKKAARREALARQPLARRDPSKLLLEIERLREAECQDRLDGPGRMRRKHLEEQFRALNRAREKAQLPVLLLPEYDPDEYLARLQRTRTATTAASPPGRDEGAALARLPLPDDEPYAADDFPPALPPYRLPVPADPGASQGASVIARAPSNLDSAVERFLREIGDGDDS